MNRCPRPMSITPGELVTDANGTVTRAVAGLLERR